MIIKSNLNGLVQLSDIADKLSTFNQDVMSFARNYLSQKSIKDILIAYNIENLNLGLRQDLTSIEKVPVGNQKSTRYERYTVYLKQKRGDISDIVTLKDKGGVYAGIDVGIGYSELIFFDTDPISSEIEPIWGQFLGISNEQIDEFVELIRPDFEKWVYNRFKL